MHSKNKYFNSIKKKEEYNNKKDGEEYVFKQCAIAYIINMKSQIHTIANK